MIYINLLCLHAVPNVAPKNIGVFRLSNTAVNITWEKLTPKEARGFVVAYIVSYDTSNFDTRRKREISAEEVTPEQSYKVVENLHPREDYYIAVSAKTSAGEGIKSAVVISDGRCM